MFWPRSFVCYLLKVISTVKKFHLSPYACKIAFDLVPKKQINDEKVQEK